MTRDWDGLRARLALVRDVVSSGEALNYTVSVDLWVGAGLADGGAPTIVRSLLGGEIVTAGLQAVTVDEVLAELGSALRYVGDGGSHPDRPALERLERTGVLTELLDLAADLFAGADHVWTVVLKPHPFYPVWWDFSFVACVRGDAIVLVGSASD